MTKEALKIALEALEKCEVAWPGTRFKSKYFDEEKTQEAITAIKEALAQPEQEPVGWLDGDDHLAEFMHKDLKAEHDRRKSSTPKAFYIPVYTTPPQRKPLSDEEMNRLINEFLYEGIQPSLAHCANFARAIEAAVWEKQK